MKKIICLFICIVTCSLMGCNNVNNTKKVSNFNETDVKIYSTEDLEKIKALLKSYGEAGDLTVKKASEKNIVVINNEKIVSKENLWNDFYNNSKNKKEDSIIVLQYTPQNDPILTYLSYKDDKFFMVEDDSRDQYREGEDKDYYEYTFKFLKLFEENNKTYVYLLDDDNITLDKLNYSLLSSNTSDWISYGFAFCYSE